MSVLIRIIGNIVFYTFLAGVVIACAELIWYRLYHVRPDVSQNILDVPKKRIALITGASGGLGAEYARLADRKLKDIDEIWLVARRGVQLRETASGLQHKTNCLTWDLSGDAFEKELKELLAWEEAEVGWLINCAGSGKIGSVQDMPLQEQTAMIRLNCTAAVSIISCCLPYMQGGDHIVNVCSAAGFQPLQKMAVYSATKGFLLRYSRALRIELLRRRIFVTAVCPYWIRDTEFIRTAEGEEKKEVTDGIRSYPLSSQVKSVAALSFQGSRLGLAVVTPGIVPSVYRALSKLISETVLQYAWEGIRRL